jgi:ribonuclease HI
MDGSCFLVGSGNQTLPPREKNTLCCIFICLFVFNVPEMMLKMLRLQNFCKSIPNRRFISTKDSQKNYTLQFDGGSRGNPGTGGSGAVIYEGIPSYGKEIWCGYFYLGSNISNNQAEYLGLIEGLRQAALMNIESLNVEGDSELIIKQVTGVYKVRNATLIKLNQEVKNIVKSFPKGTILNYNHIPRSMNGRADLLGNIAMDTKESNPHHGWKNSFTI